MSAAAAFKAARHQYRHGMRTAPVFIPGNLDSNFLPDRVGRNVRPECEEAMAMASRLHPMAPQFIPRVPAAPLVSTLRTLYRHNNPRMYADNGFGSRSVGHPYKRHALRELRTAIQFANKPILPGPVAPLAELRKAEAAISTRARITHIRRMDPLAAEVFAPVFRAMGFAA